MKKRWLVLLGLLGLVLTGSVAVTDDFEGGLANWTATGLWHAQSSSTCITPGYHSESTAAVFNQESHCDYDFGTVEGTLTLTQTLDVISPDVRLSFWSYEETECSALDCPESEPGTGPGECEYDKRYVEVSTDNGMNWVPLWDSYEDGTKEGEWYWRVLDVSDYLGQSGIVRFRFDSTDEICNDYAGWYIDDVRLGWLTYLPLTVKNY